MAKPGKRVNAAQQAEDASRLGRRLRAFELKKKGWSLRRIGEEIGVNHQTVANYIKETLDEYLVPVAEDYRKQLLAEIDDQLARLYAKLGKPQYITNAKGEYAVGPDGQPMINEEYQLKVEDRIARQLDQRAKLVGAWAPAQAEVQVTEVTQADLAAQDLINSIKAQNALTRDDLGKRAAVEAVKGAVPASEGEAGQDSPDA